MTPKGIVVIGENRLALELVRSLRENGFTEVVHNDWKAGRSIEAVLETTNIDLEQKKKNLLEIEEQVSPQTLIVSTTLAITATEAASWLSHPERLVGFGAFANFSEGKLIEIAPALQTDHDYLLIAEDLFAAIGQETEVVQDEAGFVFPRILSMIINEAAFSIMEGNALAADIDEAMKKGTNYPLGPLEWAEEIGIEEVYAVLNGLYRNLGEERYRPAPLIRKLVHAGWTGKEAGKGFYYQEKKRIKSGFEKCLAPALSPSRSQANPSKRLKSNLSAGSSCACRG